MCGDGVVMVTRYFLCFVFLSYLWFEISVDDVLAMKIFKCQGDLGGIESRNVVVKALHMEHYY